MAMEIAGLGKAKNIYKIHLMCSSLEAIVIDAIFHKL